ncbi:somatostatin receptor type 4-like [Antedon mediterranea]|uniref:somatostatin receptor type 4-like n=1 Tax=Antedon mediterranea TaxID=105859 RepID=UPI003AF74BE0
MLNSTYTDSTGLIAARCIICSVGIVANLLVIIVMIYNNIFKKSLTHTLLLHQSVVDFLGCCLFLGFYNNDAPSTNNATFFCKARVIFWYMSSTSTYNLVMVTFERYIAVLHPLLYRARKVSLRRKIPLSIPHCLGLLSSLQLAIFAEADDEHPGECMYNYNGEKSTRIISGVLLFTMYWLIPVSIMSYCYTCILLNLRRKQKEVGRERDGSRIQRNLLYTLVLVSVAFLVTVTPNFVLYLVYCICDCFAFSKVTIHEVTVLMNTSNLCINPFIYCFNFKEFQRGMRKMKREIKEKMFSKKWHTRSVSCSKVSDNTNLDNRPSQVVSIIAVS